MGLLTPLMFRLLGLVNGIVATQLVAAFSARVSWPEPGTEGWRSRSI